MLLSLVFKVFLLSLRVNDFSLINIHRFQNQPQQKLTENLILCNSVLCFAIFSSFSHIQPSLGSSASLGLFLQAFLKAQTHLSSNLQAQNQQEKHQEYRDKHQINTRNIRRTSKTSGEMLGGYLCRLFVNLLSPFSDVHF